MFRTIEYSINQIFDTVQISAIYQVHKDSPTITETKFFLNKAAGQSWFIQLRKNYLTQKLENYINHKKHIIFNGKQHPGIDEKISALDNCLALLKWSLNEPKIYEKEVESGLNKLQLVCKYSLIKEAELIKILPGPKNPSYQSSRDEISEILTFCKNQLDFENKLKKSC